MGGVDSILEFEAVRFVPTAGFDGGKPDNPGFQRFYFSDHRVEMVDRSIGVYKIYQSVFPSSVKDFGARAFRVEDRCLRYHAYSLLSPYGLYHFFLHLLNPLAAGGQIDLYQLALHAVPKPRRHRILLLLGLLEDLPEYAFNLFLVQAPEDTLALLIRVIG